MEDETKLQYSDKRFKSRRFPLTYGVASDKISDLFGFKIMTHACLAFPPWPSREWSRGERRALGKVAASNEATRSRALPDWLSFRPSAAFPRVYWFPRRRYSPLPSRCWRPLEAVTWRVRGPARRDQGVAGAALRRLGSARRAAASRAYPARDLQSRCGFSETSSPPL